MQDELNHPSTSMEEGLNLPSTSSNVNIVDADYSDQIRRMSDENITGLEDNMSNAECASVDDSDDDSEYILSEDCEPSVSDGLDSDNIDEVTENDEPEQEPEFFQLNYCVICNQNVINIKFSLVSNFFPFSPFY